MAICTRANEFAAVREHSLLVEALPKSFLCCQDSGVAALMVDGKIYADSDCFHDEENEHVYLQQHFQRTAQDDVEITILSAARSI